MPPFSKPAPAGGRAAVKPPLPPPMTATSKSNSFMLEKMEAWRKNANFKIEIVATPLNHLAIQRFNGLTIQRFMSDLIYPRSPRERMCGWMHLPRYIDKIRL